MDQNRTSPSDLNRAEWHVLTRVSWIFAFLTLLLGAVALAGWVFDQPLWRSIWKSGSEMKFNTSLANTAFGVSLLLLNLPNRAARHIASLSAASVLVLALLTLFQYLSSRSLGIDELFFRDTNLLGTTHPGRMAWHTALSLVLVALGAFFQRGDNSRAVWIAQGLALAGAFFPVQALIGYFYGHMAALAMSLQSGYMAVPTAFAIVCGSAALLLAAPDQGIMGTVTARTHASRIFRLALPIFILLPVILGWLALFLGGGAERSPEYSVAIVAVLTASLFLTLSWYVVRRLNRAEDDLREQQDQLRLITNAFPGLVSYVDTQEKCLFNNQAYLNWFGLSKESLNGRHIREVIGEERYRAIRPRVQEALSGQTVSFEGWLDCSDGTRRFVNATYIPHRSDKSVKGIFIFVQDVSEQRKAQEELIQREAEFRAMFELAAAGAALADARSRKFIRVNEMFCQITGFSESELLEKTALDLDHPDDRARDLATIAPGLRGEKDHWEIEKRYIRKDGKVVWVFVSVRLIRDKQGRPYRTVANILDITERKQATEQIQALNQELQKKLEEFQALIETVPVGIGVAADASCNHIWGNREFTRMLGVPDAKNISKSGAGGENLPFKLFRGNVQLRAEDLPMQRACRSGKEVLNDEIRIELADGRILYELCRAKPLRDSNGQIRGCIGAFLDITERKSAEEELRKSEERFRLMADASPAPIWIATADEKRIWFNKAWLEFVGRPMDQEVGNGWMENIHPDDQDALVKRLVASFEARQEFKVEHRLMRHDGEYRWVLNHGNPLYSAAGQFSGYIGSCVDISERKARSDELEQLVIQRTAKLNETISELEAFSYSISHDMRAPLRAMQGYSQMLLTDYGEKLDADGKGYLERISRAAVRLDLLIRDVLAYSKVAKEDLVLTPLDLDRLITDIVEHYPNLRESGAKVVIERPLMSVRAHEAFLSQVISNLIGNAVKFVAPGVLPEIRIRTEPAGRMCLITVEDNGIGIDPHHYERIFQIFGRVQSDKKFEGTGIGLAVVKKAVERMGGKVGVEGREGAGSRFWFTLERHS